MDNLTHSLVGALLGQAGLKRKTGLAMPALIVGANLPDVDAACFFWLEGVEHLAFRRGITHGPPAWVLLPLLLAGGLWWFDRWQTRRGKRPEKRLPVHFGWLYALALIGCLTHPALDWMNVYGIRLLEPFSSRWFYGDVLFIIDVWLWALLGGAVWFSLRREKRGGEWMRPARIAGVVALAYIGVNWLITELSAVRLWDGPGGEIISIPLPIQSYKREVLTTGLNWPGDPSEESQVPYLIDANRPLVDPARRCRMPEVEKLARLDPQLAAFMFWSRAPFAERAPDGSILIRDARYYDARARDRFTVKLPNLRCEPLITSDRAEPMSLRDRFASEAQQRDGSANRPSTSSGQAGEGG